MHPQLLQDNEYGPVRLSELDEDIRQGRVGPAARLYYPPVTGEEWVALADLPDFTEALDTPNARFTWHLRRPRLPWMSTAWTLAITVLGMAWLWLAAHRGDSLWASELYQDMFSALPVGAGSLVGDGLWWTPWTSQLLHADPFHLLWNVGMLSYCGFRVERGLGPGGYLVVAVASMAGGAALITLLGDSLVLGSSILAFGLWGGQVGIGVRTWSILPRRFRGRYGTSGFVFLFFAGLYASGFYSAGISHLGHLGGLLGGFLAALVVPGESFAPAAAVSGWFRRNVALALGLATVASLAGPLMGTEPDLAWGPWTSVEPDGSGLSVEVPWRMADQRMRVAGMPAWVLPGAVPTPVFAGLTSLTGEHVPTAEELTEWWSAKLGGVAVPLEADPELVGPPGEGWRTFRWRVEHTAQVGTVELVEHQRLRGRWVVRVGYLLPTVPELALPGGREAVYQAIIATVQVGEPPDLADIRARHGRNPRSPRLRYELAHALAFAGELAEADALLAELSEGSSEEAEAAVHLRLALWEEHPELGDAGGLAWLLPHLAEAPLSDVQLHHDALSWLLSRSHCAEAEAHEAHLRRLAAEGRPRARVQALLDELDGPLWDCGPTRLAGLAGEGP